MITPITNGTKGTATMHNNRFLHFALTAKYLQEGHQTAVVVILHNACPSSPAHVVAKNVLPAL